jgi:hypothetical protein
MNDCKNAFLVVSIFYKNPINFSKSGSVLKEARVTTQSELCP